MGLELNKISNQLHKCGIRRRGKLKFNNLLREKINTITSDINGFQGGSNITSNIIKKYQKLPTQQKLDSFHTISPLQSFEKSENNKFLKDVNLFKQLSDFINLFKPQEFVIIKFNTHPNEICVRYKKTLTLNIPWLVLWMKKFPESVIEYCTDVHNYLRLFGPMCATVNLSNLLNRIESYEEVNYTLILMSLTVFPQSDISPISRNATKEKNEVFKQIIYEDCQRKMYKVVEEVDRLVYSRTRNMFCLPALHGSNSF